MADDDATTTTTTTTVTFRLNHLVRLRGFDHAALDGKLVRIKSTLDEASGKFEVTFLDDQARPPVPIVPGRRMKIKPEHFKHACEYCLVASAADGERLQMCGRCKTARYCNAECQRADWARHERSDCFAFSHSRSIDMSSLQQACSDGNVAEVRRLVEEEGADVDKATTNGPTPLATAASHGHLSVVRYLVEKGANVDKARATSFTPLLVAAQGGILPIVQYLVEHGADKDKACDNGGTPLILAAQGGCVEVVRYLVEQGADIDKIGGAVSAAPLFGAAANGHLAVVRYLVEQGADKDKAAKYGFTPLYVAVIKGHVTVVRYLVQQGADKNKAIIRGRTPLQAAQAKGHTEIVVFLRRAGAR